MDTETKLYPVSTNPLFFKPTRPVPEEIAVIGAGTIGPDIGMVAKIADDYADMIKEAVKEVENMQGKIQRILEGKVDIPEFHIPDQPMSGKLALSREAISIIAKTIKNGAAADTFADALEIGYQGSAEIACTDAAREGISAFLEKRKPAFTT